MGGNRLVTTGMEMKWVNATYPDIFRERGMDFRKFLVTSPESSVEILELSPEILSVRMEDEMAMTYHCTRDPL